MASYSTTFSATENPLSEGGAWQDGPGAWGGIQSASGNSRPSAGSTDSATRLNTASPGATISADQYAEGVIAVNATENNLFVRMASSTDGDSYQLSCQPGSAVLKVFKVTDSGTLGFSQLGANISVTTAVSDVMKFTASGTSTTTLEVFRNTVSQGTRSDFTSPFTSGQPGVGHYNSSVSAVGFTSWNGGDTAAAADNVYQIGNAIMLQAVTTGAFW